MNEDYIVVYIILLVVVLLFIAQPIGWITRKILIAAEKKSMERKKVR